MYMGPIVAEAPERLSTRKPSPRALRLAVGVPALALSVAVMLPWLAVNAAVSGVVLGGLALLQGPRALLQAIDYAGKVALGR